MSVLQKKVCSPSLKVDDGNPPAVIDSEMPNIEERLGLWRPGQRLPTPRHRRRQALPEAIATPHRTLVRLIGPQPRDQADLRPWGRP